MVLCEERPPRSALIVTRLTSSILVARRDFGVGVADMNGTRSVRRPIELKPKQRS